MPVDVAMANCSGYLQQQSKTPTSCWSPEEMSGHLTLVGPGQHGQPVNIKVYRTSVEHFAVLYPLKKVCRPLGVLNLRNTEIERQDAGFVVRQRGIDAPMCLTFVCSDESDDLDSWVEAFRCTATSFHHHSSLAIVEEDEEV